MPPVGVYLPASNVRVKFSCQNPPVFAGGSMNYGTGFLEGGSNKPNRRILFLCDLDSRSVIFC